MRFTLTIAAALISTSAFAASEAEISAHMDERIAAMEAMGVVVEHNYAERHDQVPAEFTASFGPWEGRPANDEGPAFANVPDIPTITNLLVMEEEFAHALGSDEDVYGKDPVHQMWEEFRAKRYAVLMVEQFAELDEDAHTQNDFTIQNYINFARQMSPYTRQGYSDELIAAIRADAEAVAEAQFAAGVITITNSGNTFAKHFAR